MADEDLSQAKREWEGDPLNPAAQQAYATLLRREQELLDPALLESFVGAPRSVSLPIGCTVYAELLDRRVVELTRLAPGQTLELPAHFAWWIRPHDPPGDLEALAGVLRTQQVPGLSLEGTLVDDTALAALHDLPHLTWLSLNLCPQVSTSGVCTVAEGLPQLRHLEVLVPGDEDLGPQAIDALAGCPDLIHLYTRYRMLCDADHLVATLPRLTRLRVGGPGVTNTALSTLSQLRHLRQLELGGCGRVTRKGLLALSALETLSELFLLRCGRSNGTCLGAIPSLSPLRTLGYVPVDRVRYSCAVGEADLRSLERATQLRQLQIPARELTLDQRAQLRAALPSCAVTFFDGDPIRLEPHVGPWWRGEASPAAAPLAPRREPPPPAKVDVVDFRLSSSRSTHYDAVTRQLGSWVEAQTAPQAEFANLPAWCVFLVAPALAHAWAACPWLDAPQRTLLRDRIRTWTQTALPGSSFRVRRFDLQAPLPPSRVVVTPAGALQVWRRGLSMNSPQQVDVVEVDGSPPAEFADATLRSDVVLRAPWDQATTERFLALSEAQDPPAVNPKVPDVLAEQTGLTRPEACLLWTAFCNCSDYHLQRFLPKEARSALKIKVKEAHQARMLLSMLTPIQRVALACGALPDDPAQLWDPLCKDGPVSRLAAAWQAWGLKYPG